MHLILKVIQAPFRIIVLVILSSIILLIDYNNIK